MQKQYCLYMRCFAETQAVDWQHRSLGEMWWQHHVQVSLLIAMSRVCNITLLACFPRCTARNKVPPLSNDFSQAPHTSPRLIPPSALYAFKLSRRPIYPQIKVQHRCGARIQCIRGKKKQGNYLERAHHGNSAHCRSVGARAEPAWADSISELTLREKEEDTLQYAEKKNFSPEVKRNWHIPKSVEKVEKKENFF